MTGGNKIIYLLAPIELIANGYYLIKIKIIKMETTENAKVFIANADIPWHEMAKGVRRKVMAYDEKLMLVKVAFKAGGIGALHQHYHTQMAHVESGVFQVEIGKEKKILAAGHAFYIPSNVMHSVICIEAGVLIDSFSPAREDFITAKEV